MTTEEDSDLDVGKVAMVIGFIIVAIVRSVLWPRILNKWPWLSDYIWFAVAFSFILLVGIGFLLFRLFTWIPTLYRFVREWWLRSRHHTGEPIPPALQPAGSTIDRREDVDPAPAEGSDPDSLPTRDSERDTQ